MCNPPLLDERTGRRASPSERPSSLFADLVASGRAHHLLRAQPARGGADLPVRPHAPRGRSGTRRPGDPVPRRLHPTATPRDRASPGERGAARCRVDECARAGHRHRPPRRGDVGHLPGHGCEPAPAVGPRRDAPSAVAWPCMSRATTRWTSSSAATRRSFWTARSRPRFSTTPLRRSTCVTCAPPRTRRRSSRRTRTRSARRSRSTADRLVTAGELRKRGDRWQPRGSGLPGRHAVAALRVGGLLRGRDGRRRRADRLRRGRAGVLHASIPAPIYLHLGEPYEVEELDLDGRRRAIVRPADADYYTQPKIDTETFIEETREERDALGRAAAFRGRVRDAGGDRLPAQAPHRPRGDRPPAARPAGAELRHPGALVRAAATTSSGELLLELLGALHASEHSQIARAAADRDVRPLGHRRSVDELPPSDGMPDDLHLRRAPGRSRNHEAGLRGVRAAGRRCAPSAGRVPVPVRLPIVCAVAEVRQPERAAVQGRRARPDGS